MSGSSPTYLLKNFLKYNVIFKEGSKGDSAYLLKEGRVELSKEINEKKKVLAVLTPISLFGEMAMLMGDQKRTATAVALEDVRVIEIKKNDFDAFVKQSPQIMQTVLDVLVHRLKVATIKSMQVPSVFAGVCQILDLFAKHGVYEIDYLHIAKAITVAFVAPAQKIKNIFNSLVSMEMIEMVKGQDGSKLVRLLEEEDFMVKAVERLKGMKGEGAEE